MSDRQTSTVVIGGGQAGLAIGYHLRKRRLPFVVLDENDRIGDAWDDWLDLVLPSRNGVPVTNRGVVESCPGLYFVGLPFLYSLSSALVGGVGRDAERIVDHVALTRAGTRHVI